MNVVPVLAEATPELVEGDPERSRRELASFTLYAHCSLLMPQAPRLTPVAVSGEY
jgi:hypothetical protein